VKNLIIQKEITLREMKKFILSKKWKLNSASYHDFKNDTATYQFFESIYKNDDCMLEVSFKRYIIIYTILLDYKNIKLFVYRRLDKPLKIKYTRKDEIKIFSKQPKRDIDLHEKLYPKKVRINKR